MSSQPSSVRRCGWTAIVWLLAHAASAAIAVPPPHAVVSLEGSTLRLETGRGRRVFPVAVGRLLPDGREPARGLFYTGPDPHDTRFYLAARHEPAFHRGLPFLRLDRRSGGEAGARLGEPLFGIHGPVTPTLIWGRVSAGCIRMQPHQLRWFYEFALRHPGLQLRLIEGLDQVDGRPVSPEAQRSAQAGCSESSLGLRRLRRATLGTYLHDRVCGGVDHWWVLELKGGEILRARAQHDGGLRLELYGIRGISQIAAGRFGFEHVVPVAYRNRGDRYLRVTADKDPAKDPAGARVHPYTLELAR